MRELQERIGRGNQERGFHERGDRLRAEGGSDEELRDYYAARLSLIMTEVAEAIEALRDGYDVAETYYSGVILKPEGVPSEVADVVIRAFDFAYEAGFDLPGIIEEKLAYNATRGYRHGRKF